MDRCLLHAHGSNICFVFTDTRVKEPGVRDRRHCLHVLLRQGLVVGGMSEDPTKIPKQPPMPTLSISHPVTTVMIAHLYIVCSLAQNDSPRARLVLRVWLLLFHGRIVLRPNGWPPSDVSERIVHVTSV